MAKHAKKAGRSAASMAPVSGEALAGLVARLRDLPASAGPAEVQAAVGDLVGAVPAAAMELGRTGDDAAIAGLAALLLVPAFAVPAIEALGHVRDEAAVRILEQEAAAPGTKETGKAARRALHALTSAGMAVAMPRPAAQTAVFQPLPAEGVAWSGALAGPIDADGNRSLLLGRKRLPTGAGTATGVSNKAEGLLFFQAASQTHRQLDKEWQAFLDERDETLARDIPFPYAQWLLGEAADRLTQAGRAVPEEYTTWLEFSGGRPTNVSPRQIYEEAEVDPAAPPTILGSRSAALLEEPEITPWTLPVEAVSGYGAELLSAQNSPIVLSPEAAADRERQLFRRAADEVFTTELRGLYQRRLEETALLFLHSDRRDQAQAALAAAAAFGDAAVLPSDIPFALALTQRAVETAAEIVAPTSREGAEARTRLFGLGGAGE
jgi:hypothetical protein